MYETIFKISTLNVVKASNLDNGNAFVASICQCNAFANEFSYRDDASEKP
jgi:hypothetical protein